MTHNSAPPHEWMSYHEATLKPLRPVCLLGCSAGSAEAKNLRRYHAPMEWWKDRLVVSW